MSHHYSGADFGFPLDDARLDFCDLYAFPKPEDASRSIIVMDVHPSKAVDPEGATTSTTTEPFSPQAIYELISIPMAIWSRTSVIGSDSCRQRTGSRVRQSAASRAWTPPGPATAGK